MDGEYAENRLERFQCIAMDGVAENGWKRFQRFLR